MIGRRRLLGLIASGSAALLAGATRRARAAHYDGSRECVVRPQQVEGPFFVDTGLNRPDIRSDPKSGAVTPGVQVRLTFRVTRVDGASCLPLPGAKVDLWHCDAQGLYSDATSWQPSTAGQQFLRGYQITDRKGVANFTTIFPGWYPNRTVHMHFKIRADTEARRSKVFTSQIYFSDELADAIHALHPYATRGPRKVRNNRDVIFMFRGDQLVLPLREERRGYSGTFEVALDV